MPQEGLQTYTLLKFTGIRNWEQDNRIPNNYLYYALNSEFNGGLWKSAKGPIQYLPALTSGSNVKLLSYFPYQTPAGVSNYLIEIYNKQAYLINTDTDTRSSIAGGTRATDEECCSAVFNNNIYVNSATDGMAWFNGTAWSTTFEGGILGSTDGTTSGFTITNGGDGYVLSPNVTLTGGGGTDAQAIVDGITLKRIDIVNAGSGYSASPAVSIAAPTGANGIQATAHATVIAGAVVAITLDNPGSGYQWPPQITISDPTGTLAAFQAVFSINSLALLTSGLNYTSAPAVVIDPPTGSAPQVTAAATLQFNDGIPPKGTMMESNSGKIWVAGGGLNPAVVYYGRTATADHPEYARDWTVGSGRALIGEGGYITALRNLKNVLYVFKNNAIHYLNGFNTSGPYPIPVFDIYAVTSGAVNNNCVVQVENDLWFLNSFGEIRSLGSIAGFINDNRTQDVSIAIKRYMQQLDQDYSKAAMSYYNKVLKISHRTAGSPTNNWEFTYDFNDFGYAIKQMGAVKKYAVTNDRRFLVQDGTSGQLFEDDVGYTMAGSPFPWKGYTIMVDLGRPDLNKRLRYVEVHLGRSYGQAVTLDVYKDSFTNLPSQYGLMAPTLAETGIVGGTNGVYGQTTYGTAPWGGYSAIQPGGTPTLYRRVFKIDVNQTGKQFGIGLEAIVNGGLIQVEQINLQYIVLPEKNRPVDV